VAEEEEKSLQQQQQKLNRKQNKNKNKITFHPALTYKIFIENTNRNGDTE
jgi:hypothetical protein